MRIQITVPVMLIAGSLVCSAPAFGQPKPDCPKPEKVEGQVVNVDVNQGKLTLRGADGKIYEFTGASKETLQDKKVGDRMEVTRRMPEGCK